MISMDTHTSLRHRAPPTYRPRSLGSLADGLTRSFSILSPHRYIWPCHLLPLPTEPLDTLLYITVATCLKKPPPQSQCNQVFPPFDQSCCPNRGARTGPYATLISADAHGRSKGNGMENGEGEKKKTSDIIGGLNS